MLLNRFSLMSVMVILTLLGCSNPEVTNSSLSPNKLIASTPANKSATVESSKITSPSSVKAIAVGDITELEDNNICGKSKVTYAYGETTNYRVYICADARSPESPRNYISRNKDGSGGLELEAMNYNPKKAGKIEFKNDGYIYTLESPTAQNPEPVLRVTLPNGQLSEEQLLKYLSRSSDADPNRSSSTSSAPLEYVLQNRESLGICKDNFRAEDGKRGIGSKAIPIAEKKYLVQIQCFLAAYQGAFEYVLWIDESPKPRVVPLEFDVFQEPKGSEQPKRITSRAIAGAPRVNVRALTISNFTKFRGLADCGSSSLYKIDIATDRLVLQEYRAKYECDGKYVQDFPLIYP